MKAFKILAILAVVIVLIFAISLLFPGKYRIEKSVVINKPLFQTFAFMNDIKNWEKWSPWNSNIDSSFTAFYSLQSQGQGARKYFRGNKIGVGRFEISESIANEKIMYNLSMNEGKIVAKATFYFKELKGLTQLFWVDSVDVGYNPIYRFMMPSKINSTENGFEQGLREIKIAIERP